MLLGQLLDEEPRSRRGEQAPDLAQLVVGQVATDVRPDPVPLRRRAGVGEEGSLLAGAEVAGDGLAGPLRVSEDAEQVVDQLEGDPQHPPGLAEQGHGLVVRCGEHGPGLQGQGERVGAGLLLLHRQALPQRRTADAEREAYVGQLARGGRVQRRVEEVEEPVRHVGGCAAGRDRADRGGQGEVTGQDAGGAAVRRGLLGGGPGVMGPGVEGAAHVGPAAADVVAVDDVVVDHEGRVEQLHRRPHVGRGGRARAAEGVVGRDHERRPEPLAALGRRDQRVPETGVVGTGRRRARAAAVEQPPQGLIGAG